MEGTEMTHVLMIAGFLIWLGVAGRFDCDVAEGLMSPNMIGWILAGALLIIPEVIWFLRMLKMANMERE